MRLLGSGADFLFGAVLAFLLSGTLGRWFAHRAVVMLSIGSPDTFWRGPFPMVLGIFGEFVYGLPFALLLALLPEIFFGAAIGKWLTHLRVEADNGAPATLGQRTLRWAFKCADLWVMVLALVLGSRSVAMVALLAGAIILIGFVHAADPRGRAMHDRLAGTAVNSLS